MRSQERTELGPIDIAKAVTYLESPDALIPGGGDDERSYYKKFASDLEKDPRKVDIQRGLGGLGLLVMTMEDLEGMPGTEMDDYAGALTQYGRELINRSRILVTEGQLDGPVWKDIYGLVDIDWARQYVEELKDMRSTMGMTMLYRWAEERKKNPSSKQRARGLSSGRVEVHRTATRLAVVRVGPVQRQKLRVAA